MSLPYEEARQQRDDRRLQELELRCDGIAVISMGRQGIDPERLVSALTKPARYNQRVMGAPIDPRYVPLDQRVQFIRSVARLIATAGPVLGRPEIDPLLLLKSEPAYQGDSDVDLDL